LGSHAGTLLLPLLLTFFAFSKAFEAELLLLFAVKGFPLLIVNSSAKGTSHF